MLEVLRTEGVRHIFGNPGSTELPLIDALATADDLHYVLALQEATAVAMADGYAQATGRPAFLNLHTSAGLGNAIGNLTNARACQTPLVVTAGQQDYRHIVTDPLLAGDLTGIAGAVSKWTHEVRTTDELGTVLRRAFHDALSPPAGPVFVSIPMDLLDGVHGRRRYPTPSTDPSATSRRRAGRARVDCSRRHRSARSPSSSATRSRTRTRSPRSAAVAEALGAPVYGSPLHGNAVFPPTHPLWNGMLAPAAAMVHATLSAYERVLLVGGRAFMAYPYTPGPALPPTTELLHLSPDPYQLGRVVPDAVGALRATRKRHSRRCCRWSGRSPTRPGHGTLGRRRRPAGARPRSTNSRRPPWRGTAARRWTRWPPRTRWCARCHRVR